MLKKLSHKFVLLFVLLVISSKLYSQADTCFLGNLTEYHIVNKDLAHALDSVIIVGSSFDYHKVLNEDIFAIIYIKDTNKLKITVTPYSCTQFNQATLERDDRFNGFLFREDHLVLIAMNQFEFAKAFIEKTDKSRNVFILNSDNLIYHITSPEFSYDCEIVNGEFILETGYETSDGAQDYIYKIKQGDTWEKLAKKFHCSDDDMVKWKWYTKEKLILGNYIGWEFFVDENGKTYLRRFL
ncbi:MAG: LysM domain-containing protein [Bacteroidales bacterium]|jgi:hypothetical protein|nr:LysM domain-containing protein [Bacteroidales bacterium]